MNSPFVCWHIAVLVILSVFCCDAQASSLEIPQDVLGSPRVVTSTDLVTLREIGGMVGAGLSVSPDGRYLAFEMHQADVATNNYRVAWFVASTSPDSPSVNVGDGGDPTLFKSMSPNGSVIGTWASEYPKWSPDSRGIAYRKRVDGETQVWWSSRDGTEREQLTHNAADVEAFHWGRGGSQLFFTTDADRTDLQQADDFRHRNGHVFDYEKDWSTIDGRALYPPYLLTGGEARVWALDFESRAERLATADEMAEYEQLKQTVMPLERFPNARQTAWTRDKSGVAWVQPDNPEKQGVYPPQTLYASLAADGRNAVRCPAMECTGILDISRPLRDGLHWNSVNDEVLFVRIEGAGYSKRTLYGWRIGDEHVRKILSADEWISDCSIVGARAICFRETASYPRTIVSIDLADGSMETLVDPNPEFRNLVIGDVELFEWKNARDIETFGYLVKPPNYVPGQSYPLIFVGYRARWALRGGVGEDYPVHLLAANGFVVLVYDKPTTWKAFENYSDPIDVAKAMWGPDLFDVRMPMASFKSAIDILTEKGLVDPERVAITGMSNGVGHVNYSLIHSDLFAAAITSSIEWAPSVRFLSGGSGDLIREYRNVIGAGRYGSAEGFLWKHISLALNADRVNAPLLVNVGDQEHPWALEEVVGLKENDEPVEMVVYPDEGHVKWHPAHRLSIYERNVDWLSFWLQGVEDSAPEKVPQYERWRKLREQHIQNLEDDGKEYTLPLLPAESNSSH